MESNKSCVEMVEHQGQNQVPKRIKIDETIEEDRISSLPDCLILEILSRLDSTRDAIKTSTLCKRWQHLWTYVPNLLFHMTMYVWKDETLFDYYWWVNRALTQCRQINLNKFHFHTHYDIRLESVLNDSIRFAVYCNVQDLSISLMCKDLEAEFVLDQSFYINSCFTSVELMGCVFNPTGAISWIKLTTLCISKGELDEDLIQNILSGSPVLESLELQYCHGFRRIDITSKSVKKLVFSGYSDPDDEWTLADVLEINAPHILSLRIEQCLLLWKVVLLNVSSLVKAELDYQKLGHFETTSKEAKEEMLKGFILNLRHVKELEIGNCCRKALTRLEAKGFTFPSNMKYPDSSDNDSSEVKICRK